MRKREVYVHYPVLKLLVVESIYLKKLKIEIKIPL